MARDFDGSTDRVDYTSLFNPKNTSMTFSAWLYPDVLNSHISYLLSVNQSGDATVQNILYINTNGTMSYDWYGSSGDGRWSGTTTTTISTGQWTHYLFRLNLGAATWESMPSIWKNGVECSYASRSFGWIGGKTVTGKWAIGARTIDDTRNFDGRIALPGVWKRRLLDDEIKTLAAGADPRLIPQTLYWAPSFGYDVWDPISGQSGTPDGTALADDPSFFSATRVNYTSKPATSGPIFVPGWANRNNRAMGLGIIK